jgi:hypothetical protein
MSAVQARIHYAMKQEFKLLAGIIRDYTPEEYSYEPEVGDRRAKQSDYDCCEVIPVSDPNAATMSQKVVQYQAVMQMAQANPQIYDLPELNRQMLEVLGVKNIGKLIPTTDDQKPKDPVSENMAVLNGKPVKAFIYQDHQAHIQAHMSAIQDPQIAQMVGQSPMAQQIQSAMAAHVAEHIAFAYRNQMEEQLGVALPPPDEELPEDVEVELSKLVAQAAQQLLAKNQGEAQQQQAQQQAQDPLVQMQQQELQLKAQELQAKAQKMMADVELDKAKLELEKMKMESTERIAGAQIGAKVTMEDKQLQAKQMADGVRLGVEMVTREKEDGHKNEDRNNKKDLSDKQHAARLMQMAQQAQMQNQAAMQKQAAMQNPAAMQGVQNQQPQQE